MRPPNRAARINPAPASTLAVERDGDMSRSGPAPASQTMTFADEGVAFECGGDRLIAVLSRPLLPAGRGVVIVVGGPQYRVGSHRQFVLLARRLAAAGYPTLRFDYRGMGDSDGAARSFDAIDDDIRAAIDHLCARCSLQEVVLWGLCDGASAAMFYAPTDTRVRGLVLLNPWVRTEQGLEQARLRHYYTGRLFAREFWGNVLRGRFHYGTAARSFIRTLTAAFARSSARDKGRPADRALSLPQRMERAFAAFKGRTLFILSGNDLTAQEFRDLISRSAHWGELLSNDECTLHELPSANHTFASREWRAQVEAWTLEWVRSW